MKTEACSSGATWIGRNPTARKSWQPRAASRFVRAAYANAHHPAKTTERENVARLFRTLASVQITEGTAKSAEGHFEKTIFTSGFSSSTNTYYANTYDDFEIRAFPFESFDLDGRELQTRALYRGEEEGH